MNSEIDKIYELLIRNEGMNLSTWARPKLSTNQRPDYRCSEFLKTKIIAASKVLIQDNRKRPRMKSATMAC